jgi:hypothetical protein
MGIFYGDKITGVRMTKVSKDNKDNYDIIFEIKFNTLTQQHMNLINEAFNKINETDEIKYYFYRTVASSHELCSNSDDVLYYIWVKSTRETMLHFIEKNSSL